MARMTAPGGSVPHAVIPDATANRTTKRLVFFVRGSVYGKRHNEYGASGARADYARHHRRFQMQSPRHPSSVSISGVTECCRDATRQ